MLSVSSLGTSVQQIIPDTGSSLFDEAKTENDRQISLQEFADDVKDGNAQVIKGIYADNVFSLRVIQQPAGQPGFVSPVEGVVTQFGMATAHNVTGMLAHNFSSGRSFFDLSEDDVIDIVYGNAGIKKYQVTALKKYQALSPDSATSEFIDLDSGEQLSAVKLFNRMYTGEHHLVLQTCIQVGDEDSWGRLFVIAEPLEQ